MEALSDSNPYAQRKDARLIEVAARHGWPIKPEHRQRLVDGLVEMLQSPDDMVRVHASRALIAANGQNIADLHHVEGEKHLHQHQVDARPLEERARAVLEALRRGHVPPAEDVPRIVPSEVRLVEVDPPATDAVRDYRAIAEELPPAPTGPAVRSESPPIIITPIGKAGRKKRQADGETKA